MKYNDNDYELIYLIRENNEVAMKVMIEKYSPLIWRVIRNMRIKSSELDDFYQEGLICLFKAIDTFDDSYNKTFTRYFEMIWRRRVLGLLRSSTLDYQRIDDFDSFGMESYVLEEMAFEYNIEVNLEKMDDFEKKVYLLYNIENYSIEYISNSLNVKRKKIYNTIEKIKRML